MGEETNNTIGKRVKKIRKDAGLTLDDLNDFTGISKTYLSDLETGKADNPSIKILKKIANGLEIELPKLLEGSIEQNERQSISFGHPNVFEKLAEESSENEKLYHKAIRMVEKVLTDQSISVDARRELAKEIISLVSWIENWVEK